MVGPGSVAPGDWKFKLPQRSGRFFGSGCFAWLTFCKQRVLCKSFVKKVFPEFISQGTRTLVVSTVAAG